MVIAETDNRPSSISIISESKKIGECSDNEKKRFYEIMNNGFLGVSWEDFLRDFSEKDEVMTLRKGDQPKDVVGFGTLMNFDLPTSSQTVKLVFSGDTFVLPEYRSSTGLGVQIGHYFNQVLDKSPDQLAYYLLISKGWRTYKILPFFFHNFSPRYDQPTPPLEKEIIDNFGKLKYPREYNPRTGLIDHSVTTQRLRPDGIDALPQKIDVHTEFFLKTNPEYLAGDEIVCTARISPANFTPALNRLITA